MLDDTVFNRIAQLVEPSLALIEVLSDVCIELVAGAGNDHIIFRPPNSE